MRKRNKIIVISPSKSLSIISDNVVSNAINALNSIGFEVEFTKNCKTTSKYYNCGTIENRISDINEALISDCNIILSSIGGYNCNQLLPYLDYEKIKKSKKIICGFSDITAMLNAIYAKTGLITYYGPHFSSFGMLKGLSYTKKNFIKALYSNKFYITSSSFYRDDPWYINQNEINKIRTNGMFIINEGTATGIIIGGNLCTFNLLLGSEFLPHPKDIILFLEDGAETENNYLLVFDRNLEAILQSDLMPNIRGIVIGIAQKASNMTLDKWKKMITGKKQLNGIPVIINANFGHTTPIFTFPIGGYCVIDNNKILIRKGEKWEQ